MNYKYMFFHRNILVFKKPFLVIISKILFFLLCITLCHISIDAVLSIYMALKKSISRTLRYLALVLIESARLPYERSHLGEECHSPIKIRALVALRMFHYISRDFRSLRLDNALFGVGWIDAMVTPLREG